MEYKIIFSDKAKNDIDEIYQYVCFGLQSPHSAASLVTRILSAASSLEYLPERNPVYKMNHKSGKNIRVMNVCNYLIFYSISDEASTVYIIRVIYGRRDMENQNIDNN